ncbi:MAG: hypothetical protein ACO3LW_07035 [bacterium]
MRLIKIPNKRVLFGFRLDRVHLLVLLGVNHGAVNRLDKPTHRTPRVTNAVDLVPVAVDA